MLLRFCVHIDASKGVYISRDVAIIDFFFFLNKSHIYISSCVRVCLAALYIDMFRRGEGF